MRVVPNKRLPVSVLTGFLGSGKTTVLNHLTRQPTFGRTLVLINEFGEIGLDQDLVAYSSEDDFVVEMASGCLCCTIRGDLAKTLREAPGRFARGGELWFDRVVIETTGLADPAPILHTLMSDPSVVRRFYLSSVVTTVDTVNGADTLDRQIESVKQAAMADRLLLTKADLANSHQLALLKERLKTLNPTSPQIVCEHGMLDGEVLFDSNPYDPTPKSKDVREWLNAEAFSDNHDHHHHHSHDDHGHHAHHHDVNRHDEEIRSFCLTIDEPIAGEALDRWLDVVLTLRGADLLRMKGILNIAQLDRPAVIHGVQHIFHPLTTLDAWPSDDRRSRIVFITRNIQESEIRSTLKLLDC
ncbi:MAG: GTP-binding protein [Pseudomonadota bacterium]